MRTLNALIILGILVLCGGKSFAQETQKPGETIEQRLERLKADKIARQATETAREKEIRLRAEALKLKEELQAIEKEQRANESKEMEKARKIVQKNESRTKKFVETVRTAYVNAAITGCDAREVEDILVEPRAAGSHSWQAYVKVRVTNQEDFIVDTIEDESGMVVSNLCSHGSLTLFRSRDMIRDGANLTYHYIAKGHFPDGSLGMAESQYYNLNSQSVSSGNWQQFFSWNIRLQKVAVQR